MFLISPSGSDVQWGRTKPWAIGLCSLLFKIIFKVTMGPLSINFKHQQLLQLNSHLGMKLPPIF